MHASDASVLAHSIFNGLDVFISRESCGWIQERGLPETALR
jgi:hypothetical protein